MNACVCVCVVDVEVGTFSSINMNWPINRCIHPHGITPHLDASEMPLPR